MRLVLESEWLPEITKLLLSLLPKNVVSSRMEKKMNNASAWRDQNSLNLLEDLNTRTQVNLYKSLVNSQKKRRLEIFSK
jgi:hypothetical protein